MFSSDFAERAVLRTGHTRNIFHSSFVEYANDRQVVTAGADGMLRLSFIDSEEPGRLLHEGEGMMFMFEWMPRVPVVLAACEDGCVTRVDLRDPKPESFIENRGNAVKALAFGHHSEHVVALGGEGPRVLLYDVRKGGRATPDSALASFLPANLRGAEDPQPQDRVARMLRLRSTETISISGLRFSGDGRELLASYHGDQIYTFDAWQLDAGATVGLTTKSFAGHINFDTFLKTVTYFGPSDEYVMSGSDDGHIFIWERETVRFNPILIRF